VHRLVGSLNGGPAPHIYYGVGMFSLSFFPSKSHFPPLLRVTFPKPPQNQKEHLIGKRHVASHDTKSHFYTFR